MHLRPATHPPIRPFTFAFWGLNSEKISAKHRDWRKKSLGGSLSFMASHNGQKWSSRDFFSRREFFSRVENLFFESRIFFFSSREFFHGVENLVIETIIFISCRDYFCRVENYFFESNSDNQSRFFSSSRNFLESRIPTMPCRQLPPKWSNNMAVCRSVAYVAFLFIVVVLQVADGNVEELERFLLSIQDCISHVEQCTAPGNDRNMEDIHDLGFVERLCWNNRSVFFGFRQISIIFRDKSVDWRPFALLAGAIKPQQG